MPAKTAKTTTRFDHSNCDHPTAGAEGKKARAACRKAHAKGLEKVAKAPAKTRAPRKTPRKVATEAPKVEADDLVDADI